MATGDLPVMVINTDTAATKDYHYQRYYYSCGDKNRNSVGFIHYKIN